MVLAISHIMVAWQPVGLAMGVYDMCARYVRERRQFGAPLGAFQLVQERLARMQGDVQSKLHGPALHLCIYGRHVRRERTGGRA